MRHAYLKIIAILVVASAIISITQQAFCDDPLKKLGRGIANIATCPFEIFNQMEKSGNADGGIAGYTVGSIKGVWMTAVRALVGAYEVGTFLIPLPDHYGPVLTNPEFFFEGSMS